MATKPTFALPVAAGPHASTGTLDREVNRVVTDLWNAAVVAGLGTPEAAALAGQVQVAANEAKLAAASIPKDIPTVSLRDFGAVADWNDTAQTGTDNADAIHEALEFCAQRGSELYVPAGSYFTSENHAVDVTGFRMSGAGGHGHYGQPKLSSIVCGALSGVALHVVERNSWLSGIRIDASTARRNRGNPLTSGGITDGHGLLLGRDAADATCSRVKLQDVTVARQPTDGISVGASIELADWNAVTVEDGCRHGYYFHTGEGAGFTHRTVPSFHAQFRNVRAFECGGHALLSTAEPFGGHHNVFHNFEALGCLWKREHDRSGRLAQILFLYNGSIFYIPDIEDQQYAQTLTQSNGVSRQAHGSPAGTMVLSSRALVEHPYMSSVSSGILIGAVPGVRVLQPRVFAGTYGVPMEGAVEIVIGAQHPEVDISLVQMPGYTKSQAVRNQSSTARIRIDGEDYIGTVFTASDIRIVRQGGTPEPQGITSGGVSYPLATVIELTSETGVEDSFDFIKSRLRDADPVFDGLEISLMAAAGHTITARTGIASDAVHDNFGMDLGANRVLTGRRVLRLRFFADLGRWKEIAWFS